MNTLAIKIVNRITCLTNEKYTRDDMEVYYYGMICLLNQLCVNTIIAVWAIITHCFSISLHVPPPSCRRISRENK